MKKISIILSALLLLACSKQETPFNGESLLVVNAKIGNPTKAVLLDNDFQAGNMMGMFIYHADKTVPLDTFALYGNRYGNIAGKYQSSGTWLYNFEGASTNFTDIYLMMPTEKVYRDDRALKLCAYHPWVKGVTSIASVPFTLGGKSKDLQDVMWAVQNGTSENIIIPNTNVLPVALTFNHALARLKIGFRCAYDNKDSNGNYIGTTLTLSSISLKKAGSTPLYSGGNLNALTGSVTSDKPVDVLTVDYTDDNKYSFAYRPSGDYIWADMLIFPEPYVADGDYILEFSMNGQTLKTSYPVKLSDVAGGFLPGHVYTFKFTMDNTVNFTGVSVEVGGPETWESNYQPLEF